MGAGRRYACEFKLAKQVVILGHGMLTFINLNEYTGLVVRVGCEGLRLLGGNGGVALDEDSHDSTSSFNSKGKRSDIQQQQVLNIFRFVSR